MFYKANDVKRAGRSYELDVFSRLQQTYHDDFAFGIHGFPMFYRNGSFREIDILFMHRTMGAFNIEVKGIQINQIKQIVGHTWKMENFYCDHIAPFDQAQQQTYMLREYLNTSLLLGKKMRITTLIALPEITQEQWEARNFHHYVNIPTPIFKDDLQSNERLHAKLQTYISSAHQPLVDEDWSRLLDLFQIDTENVNETYEVQLFSKVFIFNNETQFTDTLEEIERLLQLGVKIYVFDQYDGVQTICENRWKVFLDAFQLEVFTSSKQIVSSFATFENGQIPAPILEQLIANFEQFNSGQFLAIHCPVGDNEMITAGAGTGKTHVMIDRILYLVTVARVELCDIIMITFTNASTNEMRKRLEHRFLTLFELTGQGTYLRLAENVRTMQISTIHAYAKTVIEKLGHELGYGQSIKLRSFAYEKKQIIQKLLDSYFVNQKIEFFKVHQFKHYQFVQFAFDLWEEMEKKGLSTNEIKMLDWGTTTAQSKNVGELLQYIFMYCEDELEKLKAELNAVSMGDLIRKLKSFSGDERIIQQLPQNCFMFVDEFQDSDDVQITFIAELQKLANYKLFVVGDTKQSIYRFRGADYRSFDVLEEKIQPTAAIQKISLRHNYRSAKALLRKMDNLFLGWGRLEQPLLQYDYTTALMSEKSSNYKNDWIVHYYANQTERHKMVKESIQEAVRTVHDNKTVAILVRTNFQAKEMKLVCDELDIATTENLDGTFYKSLAVKHFKALIDMLLYPNEPKFFITGIQTPYFRVTLPPQQLMRCQGDRQQLEELLAPIKQQFVSKYIHLLRENSVMTIIQMIIAENNVLSSMKSYLAQQGDHSKQAELEAARYIANLQHLMNIIERQFNQQNLSLYSLTQWLTIQMSTNRSENEPVLENTEAQVIISTVHRSKGLEFDTVILPVTDKQYNYVKSSFYIENSGSDTHRIGWCVKTNAENIYENIHFSSLSEIESLEQQKEEVRLLYVAYTRAEQRIITLLPSYYQVDSWSALIKKAMR